MKKKVILAMCIAAALALAGCGNKNEAAKTDDGQEEAEQRSATSRCSMRI